MNVSLTTVSRLGNMRTIHWTAFGHAESECADAESAQGDGQNTQDSESIYARALDEIACAVQVLLGSAVEIAKAVKS